MPASESESELRLVHTDPAVDVPVQYFQSVIAIELAVAGALLWQIRFFESKGTAQPEGEPLPDPRLRLGLALVLGATVFGSLWAMANKAQSGRRLPSRSASPSRLSRSCSGCCHRWRGTQRRMSAIPAMG
jgi:hypothetical protein